MKRTAHAFALSMTLCACGAAYDGGMQVIGDVAVDPNAIVEVAHYVNGQAQGVDDVVALVELSTLIVETIPDSFACLDHGQEATCNGTTTTHPDGSYLVKIAMRDVVLDQLTSDVRRTATCHEMWHILVDDGDHRRADVWGPDGTVAQCYRYFAYGSKDAQAPVPVRHHPSVTVSQRRRINDASAHTANAPQASAATLRPQATAMSLRACTQ